MRIRTAVKILTAASLALCMIAMVSCLWYIERDAMLSALLEYIAFIITLVGSIYGASWLQDNRGE